jgi:hypothetical protein
VCALPDEAKAETDNLKLKYYDQSKRIKSSNGKHEWGRTDRDNP